MEDPDIDFLSLIMGVQMFTDLTITQLKDCKDEIDDDHLILIDRALTTIIAQQQIIKQVVELHFEVKEAVEAAFKNDSKPVPPSTKGSKGTRKW